MRSWRGDRRDPRVGLDPLEPHEPRKLTCGSPAEIEHRAGAAGGATNHVPRETEPDAGRELEPEDGAGADRRRPVLGLLRCPLDVVRQLAVAGAPADPRGHGRPARPCPRRSSQAGKVGGGGPGPSAAFPWDQAIAAGLGVLGLRPADFWAMTPRELSLPDLVDGFERKRLIRRGVPIKTDTYTVGGHLIWGATARILGALLERLRPVL